MHILDTVSGALIDRQVHKVYRATVACRVVKVQCMHSLWGTGLPAITLMSPTTGGRCHAYCSIISTCCLQGCRGPVHAQFVENWVAYHYFDVTNHRWEMSVLELYNKAQGNVTISDMVFGKISNSMSSYEPVPAEVRLSVPG